jgi:hypothetical protein
VPTNNAKLLAGALAIECTKIALPPTPLLWIEDLMEFRAANTRAVKTRTEVMKTEGLVAGLPHCSKQTFDLF